MQERFKVGDLVMFGESTHYEWGLGRVIANPGGHIYKIDFNFYGEKWLDLERAPIRIANADDLQWRPPQPPLAEEPCKIDTSLEIIESELERWENTVRYYAEEFDTDDDFDHEVFGRYCLHGSLNGFVTAGNILPDDINTRLQAADQTFIASTFETNDTTWNSREHYDKKLFWYYYRFPISAKS